MEWADTGGDSRMGEVVRQTHEKFRSQVKVSVFCSLDPEAGRKLFREFLRKCIRNFVKAEQSVKLFGNTISSTIDKDLVPNITVISSLVSLDSRVREVVNRNMVDPTPQTFDEAQLQIYTLMHRDSYPRFINSALFKQLAQLNNNSSSGGGGSGADTPTTGSGGRKESNA
uniref:RGS domain-containing protein n=1 Tax=Timema douglasi TaxID=61478 RepID=A0A7R8Z5U4_TIMDO|nr:unnamed protein product [Timema douglasi]